LWAFALFISGHKKQLYKTIVVVLAVICILYIIPFLSKNWLALYESFKDYESLPLHEWYHLDGNGLPCHLYAGTGFAHLFYEKYIHTDLLTGYKLLKKIFYLSILFTLLAMGVWYWFNWKKIDNKIFFLASFKIYLSVFLAFILIPYMYLMLTANFVSIAIFAEQARYRLGPKQ